MPTSPAAPRIRNFVREWIITTGALLLLGILMSWIALDARSELEETERQHLAHEAKVLHDNLARQFLSINNALVNVRSEVSHWQPTRDQLAEANNRLHAFVGTTIGIRTMSIIDAQGRFQASSRPELVGMDFSTRHYYQTARAAPHIDTLYVSPPFKTVLGAWAIVVGRMIGDAHGNFAGMVIATLEPEEFNVLLDSVRYAPDMWSALIHGDGVPFLIVPPRYDLEGINLAQPGFFLHAHLQSERVRNTFIGFSRFFGGMRLMALHTIQPPALQMDKPLVIFVSRELKAVHAFWRQRTLTLVMFYLAVVGMAIWGMYSIQKRHRLYLAAEDQSAQERAAVERQIVQLEERWRSVLEATNQGVGDWNVQTGKVYLSAVWKTMLGHSEDEISDDIIEWEGRVHPDDHAAMRAVLQRHFNNETAVFECSFRMRCKDGHYIWVANRGKVIERNAQGQVLRMIGTQTNITAERLRQERLNRIAENVPGMLYQYLLRADGSGAFPYASQGIKDIYALTPEQVHTDASAIFERIHPDDVAAVRESIMDSAHSLTLWRDEYRVLLPERGLRWLLGTAMPQAIGGSAVLWHGYIYDTTEAKEQQLALREAKSAAEAASRAKSDFVANMSHEIRTPMNAVLGLLQLLRYTELSTQQLDYIDKAHGAACSLLDIINDILDFSKIEAGQMSLSIQPFALDQLLRNLEAVLTTAACDKPLVVRCVVGAQVPNYLCGDDLRLRQVLLNLAGNAIKFTERGEVLVSVALRSANAHEVNLEFAVSDTGMGIPEDRLQAIFEAFTQAETSTTRRFGGTGLGLPISEKLVRLMGGTLTVESILGHGSRFAFSLPFAIAVPSASAVERPQSLKPHAYHLHLSGLRILVVEDNQINQQVARQLLTHAGAEVEVASDAQQGIEALRCAQPEFSAVLMDIQMPGMDGYEATRIMRRELGATLPIIAMTANALPSDRAASLAAGMNDHLSKPIDTANLINTLLHYCRGLTTHSEPTASAHPLTSATDNFDIENALARLGGNRTLYAMLVRDFADKQQNVAALVRQALEGDDHATARRALHTFKGLAATLGAERLWAIAGDLELHVRAGNSARQLDPALHNLQQRLDSDLAVLLDMAAALANPQDSARRALPSDNAQLRMQLVELEELLAAWNLRALDAYAALKDQALAQQPALDSMVNRLDFVAAQRAVTAWLNELKI